MTTDPRRRDVYMHISALPQTSSQSPEEIRTQDYLTAYLTTGRPPIPVPQDPADERERVALGLPPLFQPHVEVHSGSEPTTPVHAKSPSIFGTVKAVTEPSQLPKVHLFQPLAGNDGETYHSMSALPEFKFFSHEELRYYSYAAGIIFAPTPLPTNPAPFSPTSSISPPIVHPFFARDGSATAFFDEPNPVGQGTLYFQTISAARRFDKHCLEELRIAFLRAGRELDSSQIAPATALGIVPSSSGSPVPTLFGTPGGAFAHSPAIRPF